MASWSQWARPHFSTDQTVAVLGKQGDLGQVPAFPCGLWHSDELYMSSTTSKTRCWAPSGFPSQKHHPHGISPARERGAREPSIHSFPHIPADPSHPFSHLAAYP